MAAGLTELLLLGHLLFPLHPPIAADMAYLDPALPQHTPDEQAPMAFRGVFLAAEDRHGSPYGFVQQPFDTLLEAFGRSELVVQHVAFGVVEGLGGRPAADGCAEETVCEALTLECALESLLVEVHGVAGVGTRADIHHHSDSVLPEQRRQSLERMIRVPDREDAPIQGWRRGRHR